MTSGAADVASLSTARSRVLPSEWWSMGRQAVWLSGLFVDFLFGLVHCFDYFAGHEFESRTS